MPEGLAHDVELGALLHVVGGEGVPQAVGRGARNAGLPQVLADDAPDRPGAQGPLELAQEQVLLVDLRPDGQVGIGRPAVLSVERDDAVLAPLAVHPQRADAALVAADAGGKLDVAEPNPDALGLADAGLQE